MIDSETAVARCADLVETARRLGADAADAVTSAQASESVSIRLGKLEEVERSEGESISLRVMVGQRSASIQTSDFSRDSFAELAERALAMARLAPEDPYSGLAPQDRLFTGAVPDLALSDPHEPSPEALREAALEAEDAARAIPGVTNSDGGSASFSQSVSALVTSHGFAHGYEATGHSLSASVVAGEGGRMQTDYDYRAARHRADLPGPAAIGAEAGRRAVAKLDPKSMPSGPLPVVFDPRVGNGLIGHLLGAMSGPAVARKSSFLLGKEEDELFDSAIRILEEPHRPRGLRSRPFDGEGLPTNTRALVENGRIFGWLTNAAAARQLEAPLTGHAARGMAGQRGLELARRGGIGQPAEDTAVLDQRACVGRQALAVEGPRAQPARAVRLLEDANRGIEQFVLLLAEQEGGFARHRGAAHRPQQMADQSVAHPGIEHHRERSARHRFRVELGDRAAPRLGADRRRAGQIGAVARGAIVVIGLHPAALARDHAGGQAVPGRLVAMGKPVRGDQRADRLREAGAAAVGIGHAGNRPRCVLGLERGFAQSFGARLVGVREGEIGDRAGEQAVLRREAGIGILRREPRHRQRPLGQFRKAVAREIAGLDRGGALPDHDPQRYRLALRAFDLFQLAEPYRDAFGSLGAGHRIGGIGAQPSGGLDQIGAARHRRFGVDHAGEFPEAVMPVRVGRRAALGNCRRILASQGSGPRGRGQNIILKAAVISTGSPIASSHSAIWSRR